MLSFLRSSLAPLWGAFLLALLLIVAKTAFGAPGSEALSDADQVKIARVVHLTEQLLRARGSLQPGSPRPALGPISPEEAAGFCGDAANLLELTLRTQGVPPENVYQGGSSWLGAPPQNSHVFVVYRTVGSSGEPLIVILDPTFVQFERARANSQENLRTSTLAPGPALAADPVGVQIVNQIRQHGYWVISAESFSVWKRAMGGGPTAGLSWEGFVKVRGEGDYIRDQRRADRTADYLRQRGHSDVRSGNVIAFLKNETERITPEQLETRRAIGAALNTYPCLGALYNLDQLKPRRSPLVR